MNWSRPVPSRPTISIVTPSYNQAQYLRETIESVLSQEGRGLDFELEYVVVDGGSTDGSAEIIREYKNDLHWWCSEPDGGQSHAINKGFEQTGGDILCWLNSDDVYPIGVLQHVASVFQSDSQPDIVVGQRLILNQAGEPVGTEHYHFQDFHLDMLVFSLYPPQEACFWNARVHADAGRLREDLHYSMDFDWFLRLSRSATVYRSNEYLGAIHAHDERKGPLREEARGRRSSEFGGSI